MNLHCHLINTPTRPGRLPWIFHLNGLSFHFLHLITKRGVSIKKTWWWSIHSTLDDPLLFSGAPNNRSACPYRCYHMYDGFATYMYLSHFICFISCVGLVYVFVEVLKSYNEVKINNCKQRKLPFSETWSLMCGSVCHWHCRWGESLHMSTLHTQSFSLTSAMSHVTKMHLGNCPALRGFVKRRRGMRMEKRIGCWSQPRIYVPVTEPFMRTQLPLFFRGSCLFASEAAVQILAVVVHLLPLRDSLHLSTL